MKPEKIVKNVSDKNSANTRIFTFGVGDDVNTALLDQISDNTKALSTYVRPAEDIETKVTSLYGKISHPVLANVRLTASENLKIHDIYPAQMPDLFFGTQLVVLGKYTGQGAGAIRLLGQVGKETREFAYDVKFPDRTSTDRDFVEHLWARRKVGFLLDQIRINGEQKELMDEMMTLAKKYGIATPYTSYLVVPDAPMPVVNPTLPPGAFPKNGFGGGFQGGFQGGSGFGGGGFNGGFGGGAGPGGPTGGGMIPPPALTDIKGLPKSDGSAKVIDAAKELTRKPGDTGRNRGDFEADKLNKIEKELEAAKKELADRRKADPKGGKDLKEAEATADRFLGLVRDSKLQNQNFEQARMYWNNGQYRQVQAGRVGVDVAMCANTLRTQDRVAQTANKLVQGRNCLEIGGLWVDEGYTADMKTVIVKAQSDAYFKILEKHPKMKDVFRLGNHLVFVLPNKTALIVDLNDGKETLSEAEIDSMFVSAK